VWWRPSRLGWRSLTRNSAAARDRGRVWRLACGCPLYGRCWFSCPMSPWTAGAGDWRALPTSPLDCIRLVQSHRGATFYHAITIVWDDQIFQSAYFGIAGCQIEEASCGGPSTILAISLGPWCGALCVLQYLMRALSLVLMRRFTTSARLKGGPEYRRSCGRQRSLNRLDLRRRSRSAKKCNEILGLN